MGGSTLDSSNSYSTVFFYFILLSFLLYLFLSFLPVSREVFSLDLCVCMLTSLGFRYYFEAYSIYSSKTRGNFIEVYLNRLFGSLVTTLFCLISVGGKFMWVGI